MVAKKATKKQAKKKTTKKAVKVDAAPEFTPVEVNKAHVKYNKTTIKQNKTKKHTKHFGLAIITVLLIIAIISLLIPILSYEESYQEDGICVFSVQTFEEGDKEKKWVRVEDSFCNVSEDCRIKMRELRFSENDIRKMKMRCVER